jgi:hypothetical protein
MMARGWVLLLGVAVGVSTAATRASADEAMPRQARDAPTLVTPDGATLSVGAGVFDYADGDMRDFTDIAGAWSVRGVYGTRSMLAVEAGYTGTAQQVDAIGLDSRADMLTTGLHVAARYNFLRDALQPYAIAGVGWRHYALINDDFNTSSVADNDDVFEIPLGGGVAYRYRGLMLDARGVFRPAFGEDLIDETESQVNADLHNWSTELSVGWEF